MSGIENEPLYTAGDRAGRLRARPRLSGRLSVHARRLSVDVPRPAVDDAAVRGLRHGRGDERALPLPARARPDGALDGVRHADADGLRLRPRALARRGRPRGRRDRLARRHGDALRRHPAERRLDVDDDQRAGGDAARVLRLRRREAGRAARGAARHGADRHPQGVHRAEGMDLPAEAVDAARRRHDRVVLARDAADAPGLDQRLPHPRGGLDRGAGAGVHARRRLRVRRRVRRARAGRRRFRAAALVLLQRAPRLLRGDREVPRGAADLGAADAREVRGEESALVADALPHADGRRFADGAAAGGQPHPHRDRGAGGRARRHAVAAHELVRRGARAADRERGAARAAHAAGDRARDRRRQHDRSARRLVLRRAPDERARAPGLRVLRPDRAARRRRARRSRRTSSSARSPRRRTATSPRSRRSSASSSASTATSSTRKQPLEILRIDPALEQKQIERVQAVRGAPRLRGRRAGARRARSAPPKATRT